VFFLLTVVWCALLFYYRWANVSVQKLILPIVFALNILSLSLQISNWLYANQSWRPKCDLGARHADVQFPQYQHQLFLFLVISKGWRSVSRRTLGQATLKLLLARILHNPSLLQLVPPHSPLSASL
jgi:hypothetical protein